MKYRYQYTTENEKQSLITQHSDKTLIEEANLFDGNYLVLSDGNPIENDVETLKIQLQATQEAIDFLIMGGM